MSKQGVDYSWARPGGAALKAAGKEFAVRYIPYPGHGGKGLDAGELADLRANGLAVAMVFESYAARALEGFGAGAADAQASITALAGLGMGDLPVYFAVDFDAAENQQGAIDDYLRGAASVIGANRVGVYAGYWICKRCKENGTAKYLWQTYAWSGGNVLDGIHLFQYKNGQNINGAVDLNEARQDNYGQLAATGGAPTPTPAPVPSGDHYTVNRSIPGYVNAGDAASTKNSNSTVPAGTYAVFNQSNGMLNVTRQAGVPGWWINPAQNGSAQPSPAPSAPAGGYALNNAVAGYVTALDAANRRNSNSTVPAGTYAVFSQANGMVNITRVAGVPGWWINPGDNGSGSAPAPSAEQFVTVQSGWGLSSVAQAAGFPDAGTEARWAAIASLNGSNNWSSFNSSLKPGQSVRVR